MSHSNARKNDADFSHVTPVSAVRPVETVFPNGLRLLVIPLPQSPTVTASVLVSAGSKYEKNTENGLSHFLEHMCFKGTTKRPAAFHISRELDRIGAQYNAFTSQEYTGYYAKASVDHTEKILDVVADIYLHSLFAAEEINKEKGVIIEEMHMYRDMPNRHVQDMFLELVYGNQPAGWNIAGTEETVSSFTHDDFVRYHKEKYVSGATTVVVSGHVDPEEIKVRISALFAPLASAPQATKVPVIEAQNSPQVSFLHRVIDQTHLVVGVRAFDLYDPRFPALRVLAALLGGGMSSRLFEKLRNELGICYYVYASPDTYTDHGLVTICAGVDVKRAPAALTAIMQELRDVRDVPISEDELSRVKENLIGSLYVSLETSDDMADFYGSQALYKKPLKTPEQVAQEIAAVSAKDVGAVAKAIIADAGLNLALIGPYKDASSFQAVLSVQ